MAQYPQIVWVFLLLVITVGSQPLTAQPRPLPYNEYLTLIGRFRGEAINAQSRQGENCNAQLDSLARQLHNITQVQMPDGTIVQIDHAAAGLPTGFPYCNPASFVRYLNGICPEAVCLTSGVVVPPDFSENAESDFSDLADFTPGDLALQPDSLANDQPVDPLGDPLQQLESGQPIEEAGPPGEAGQLSDTSGGTETADSALSTETVSQEGSGNIGEQTGDGEAGASDAAEGGTSDAALTEPDGENGSADTGQVAETGTENGETAAASPENSAINPELSPSPQVEAVVEPDVQNRRWLWLSLGLSVLAFTAVFVFIWYRNHQNQSPSVSRQTVRKVEEEVQTGRKLLTQGEYREAIHKLFNATLHILEDRGMLRFEQTRTNYELIGSASTVPLLVPHLMPVVDAYDRVWYGSEPLAIAEYETLIDQIDKLKTIPRA